MPKTNRDGKPIRRVLSWLLNRDLTDSDIAAALEVDKTYLSRHKDDDDFPSFEDIRKLAVAFGLSDRALQISFGYRGLDELILLDREGMYQYMEAGGGNYPNPERDDVRHHVDSIVQELKAENAELHALRAELLSHNISGGVGTPPSPSWTAWRPRCGPQGGHPSTHTASSGAAADQVEEDERGHILSDPGIK